MRKTFLALAIVSFVGFFSSARSVQAQTFIVTGGGGGVTDIGLVLTTTPDPNNATGDGLTPPTYDITGVTGSLTLNGVQETVTGILPPSAPGVATTYVGPDINFTYNDLISATAPYIDDDGFVLDVGTLKIYIWLNGSSYVYYDSSAYLPGDDGLQGTDLSLTFSETPEPASMLLFGTGLLAMGLLMRKRSFA